MADRTDEDRQLSSARIELENAVHRFLDLTNGNEEELEDMVEEAMQSWED